MRHLPEPPAPERRTPANVERYRFQHLYLRATWPDEQTAALARRILAHHGLHPDAGSPSQSAWALTLKTDEPADPSPSHGRLLARHFTGLCFYENEGITCLRRGADTCRIDPSNRLLHLTLPSLPVASGEEQQRTLYLFLTFSLLILFQNEHLFALHAAALAPNPDSGLLLIGPSNSGKSTFSMHLVESGWYYLSDDSILLMRNPPYVEVSPLREDFLLDPDVAAHFPRLGLDHDSSFLDPAKWSIAIDHHYPRQSLERCRPTSLLFPEILDEPSSRLVPLPKAEALLRLMPQASFLVSDPVLTAEQLEVLKSLVEQAASYRLLAGRDIKTSSAAARALLHPLFPS